MKILVLNGPNLNLLGLREPEVYGRTTLQETQAAMTETAARLGAEVVFFQSNHEGELIDSIQQGMDKYDGLIINPGALTHTSLALADALRSTRLPAVEVHLTNIHAREEYRRQSLTAPAAVGLVAGLGWRGYLLALEGLVDFLKEKHPPS
jgi:3-dehydroquinate dehydratase-2